MSLSVIKLWKKCEKAFVKREGTDDSEYLNPITALL